MQKKRLLITAFIAISGIPQGVRATDATQQLQNQILFESMLYRGGSQPDLRDKNATDTPASMPTAAPAAVAAPPAQERNVVAPPQEQAESSFHDIAQEDGVGGPLATQPQAEDAAQETADAPTQPQKTYYHRPAAPPPARPVRVNGLEQKAEAKQQQQRPATPAPQTPAKAPVQTGSELIRRAEAGEAEAEYRVGMMYAQDVPGRVSGQNFNQSYHWFSQAASKGHPRAQYNLGVMYAQGDGIVQNLIEAYIWFNLAAAQHMEGALEARDMIAASLTPAALMKAQERSTLYHQQINDNLVRMQTKGPSGVVPVR